MVPEKHDDSAGRLEGRRRAWADMVSDSEESHGDGGDVGFGWAQSSPSRSPKSKRQVNAPCVSAEAQPSASSYDGCLHDAAVAETWARDLGLLADQLKLVAHRAPLSVFQAVAIRQEKPQRRSAERCDDAICAAARSRLQNTRREATQLRSSLNEAAEEVKAAEALHAYCFEEFVEAEEFIQSVSEANAEDTANFATSSPHAGLNPASRLRPCSLSLRLYEEQLDRIRPAEAVWAERARTQEMDAATAENATLARVSRARTEIAGAEVELREMAARFEKLEESNKPLQAAVEAAGLSELLARCVEVALRSEKGEEESEVLQVQTQAMNDEVNSAKAAGNSRIESLQCRIQCLEEETEALRSEAVEVKAPKQEKTVDDGAAKKEWFSERNAALAQEARVARDKRDRAWHRREVLLTEVEAARSRNKEDCKDQLELVERREKQLRQEAMQPKIALMQAEASVRHESNLLRKKLAEAEANQKAQLLADAD